MKKLFLVKIFLFIGLCTFAQVPPVSPTQMQQVKVDDLTDDQIRQLVAEMKRNKVGLDQFDTYATQKGIPSSESAKLKSRIVALNLDKELTDNKQAPAAEQLQADRSVNDGTVISAKDIKPMTEAERRRAKIFGAELFSNQNLTFEPNLRMATPPQLQAGSGRSARDRCIWIF